MTVGFYSAQIDTGTVYDVPIEEDAPLRWIDEAGFFAPIIPWLVPKALATSVLTDLASLSPPKNREVLLHLGDPNVTSKKLDVARVIVLGTMASDNPQRVYLLLTDVRWYFTRTWAAWDANYRRRTGNRYLYGEGNQIAFTAVPEVAYGAWSLDGSHAAYTWNTLATAVMNAATTTTVMTGYTLSWVKDSFSIISIDANVVPSTTTDANMAQAVARAIEAIPGACIRVNPADGVIHIFESTPGAEESVCAGLPDDLYGQGDLIVADRSTLRASNTRVLFDPEYEIRFTYNMSGTGQWAMVTVNDPFLLPMIQVTDQQLTIPAGTYYGVIVRTTSNNKVGVGSWITQAEAFAAWGAPSGALPLPALTDTIVASHWFDGGLDLYTISGALGYDPVWGQRIEQVRRCFRTYFRINPVFFERVRHVYDRRAAVIDPATGTRAPSPVYANFATFPKLPQCLVGLGALWRNIGGVAGSALIYPDVTGNLADGAPSGFETEVIDEELGLIRVNRDFLRKFPGASDIAVSDTLTASNTIDSTLGANELCLQKLKRADSGSTYDWKYATVLSCIPAGPNDARRLYMVNVTQAQAAAAVGISSLSGNPANGPGQELRSLLTTARFGWTDSNDGTTGYPQILNAFDNTTGVSGSVIGSSPDPANYSDANYLTPTTHGLVPINLESEVIPVALAMAAAKLLARLDCRVGTKSVPGDRAIKPIGSIRRVVHEVRGGDDAHYISVVTCTPPEENSFHAVDFLPPSARRWVLHELTEQGR